jgi:hypothetical protein
MLDEVEEDIKGARSQRGRLALFLDSKALPVDDHVVELPPARMGLGRITHLSPWAGQA